MVNNMFDSKPQLKKYLMLIAVGSNSIEVAVDKIWASFSLKKEEVLNEYRDLFSRHTAICPNCNEWLESNYFDKKPVWHRVVYKCSSCNSDFKLVPVTGVTKDEQELIEDISEKMVPVIRGAVRGAYHAHPQYEKGIISSVQKRVEGGLRGWLKTHYLNDKS